MQTKFNRQTICEYDFIKVEKYLNDKRSVNWDFNILLCGLESLGDVIVIGGAVRDTIISNQNPRDIDLIVDTDKSLDSVFEQFDNVYKNRFGGYKLLLDDLEIDVWSIENHWAFKEKVLEKSFNNIKYSTFLNFDAIFYNTTKKIGCPDFFNEAINNSFLDITLEESFIDQNPSKDVNIVRMFVIEEFWDLNFSDKIQRYIVRWLEDQDNPLQALWEAQKRHYRDDIKLSWDNMEKKLSQYCRLNV